MSVFKPLNNSNVVSNPAKVLARFAMEVTVKEELTCSPTLLTCRVSWLGPEPAPNMLVRLLEADTDIQIIKTLPRYLKGDWMVKNCSIKSTIV